MNNKWNFVMIFNCSVMLNNNDHLNLNFKIQIFHDYEELNYSKYKRILNSNIEFLIKS